MLEERNN